ncbi:hypothetical protein BIW11_12207 [Tropilaelaps mercedesae]|uniref:Uncharacterized protein n=1 Tax=Tropilaelaps mercedesae TaxID=418985 RepID=A0A1V9X814_9ACAR|nr:hypothetical protein BIW11_12207 [Tropilaelaps mercedesae]
MTTGRIFRSLVRANVSRGAQVSGWSGGDMLGGLLGGLLGGQGIIGGIFGIVNGIFSIIGIGNIFEGLLGR